MKLIFLRLAAIAIISLPNMAGTKDCLELFASIRTSEKLTPSEKKKQLAAELYKKKDRLSPEELQIVLDLAREHQYAPINPEDGVPHVLTPKVLPRKSAEEHEEDVLLAAEAVLNSPNDSALQLLALYNFHDGIERIDAAFVENIESMPRTDPSLVFDGRIPYKSTLSILDSLRFSSRQLDEVRTAANGLKYNIAGFSISHDRDAQPFLDISEIYPQMVQTEWNLILLSNALENELSKQHVNEERTIELFRIFIKDLSKIDYVRDVLFYGLYNSYLNLLIRADTLSSRILLNFPNNPYLYSLISVSIDIIDMTLKQSVKSRNLKKILLPYDFHLQSEVGKAKVDTIVNTANLIMDTAYLQPIDNSDLNELKISSYEQRNQAELQDNKKLSRKLDQLLSLVESKNSHIQEIATMHLYALITSLERGEEIPEAFLDYSLSDLDPAGEE